MSESNMQGQYAGCASRFTAWLIDRIIIMVIVTVAILIGEYIMGLFDIQIGACDAHGNLANLSNNICWGTTLFLVAFGFLFPPIYMIFFWVLTGQTPGKALVGVRIVRTNAEPITMRVAVRRYLSYLISFVALGLGFVAILLDNQRQAWHDSFAKTFVVYAWSARQNQPLIDRLSGRVNRNRKKIEDLIE